MKIAVLFLVLGIAVAPCAAGIVTVDADEYGEACDIWSVFSGIKLS